MLPRCVIGKGPACECHVVGGRVARFRRGAVNCARTQAIKMGVVQPKGDGVTDTFYLRSILPIGLGQAITFKFGTQAYLYVSVAFLQMAKAFSPATTTFGLYLVGRVAHQKQLMAIAVIVLGTIVASSGEVTRCHHPSGMYSPSPAC